MRPVVPGAPSRTALGAATHRAVHQVLEHGRVFSDPLAWVLLDGVDRDRAIAAGRSRTALRLFVAMRQRFAEDAVAAAHGRGTRQVVVLGAGLDTFAYRHAHRDLTVFEVDHPDTAGWKRTRLAAAGVRVPGTVRYVGTDLEREDPRVGLEREGFDPGAPATFVWLGVVPYLTGPAVRRTLERIGALGSTEVVLDYPAPSTADDPDHGAVRRDLERRTAAVGEPMLTALEPAEMAAILRSVGLSEIEDLGRAEYGPRYLGLPGGSSRGGGHVVRARRPDAPPGG